MATSPGRGHAAVPAAFRLSLGPVCDDGGMGLARKYLGADETEILHLHAHVKALILPVLALFVLAFATGAAVALTPSSWPDWSRWAEAGLLAALAWAWSALPFLRWLTTAYTLTDRRIITRRGILTRRGHDLPLSRIVNVEYSRGLLDRMLGCGTLVFETAADEPVALRGIPDVERVHVLMTELLFRSQPPVPEAASA